MILKSIIIILLSSVALHAHSQKWSDWSVDSTYSITECLRIQKFRFHKKKTGVLHREEFYYNQCGEIDYSIKSKDEGCFGPRIKGLKFKEYESSCEKSKESFFPEIINRDIRFSVNHLDSTLTVTNSGKDTLNIFNNNEWDHKEEGMYLGEISPNSSEKIDISYCFYIHGWIQYLEFRKDEQVVKRDILMVIK